jgi:hypothetical protein
MKYLTDNELERMYDQFLDEVYEPVKIAGLSYSTSEALKEIDRTAYDQGFIDWLDSQVNDSNLYYSYEEDLYALYEIDEESA